MLHGITDKSIDLSFSVDTHIFSYFKHRGEKCKAKSVKPKLKTQNFYPPVLSFLLQLYVFRSTFFVVLSTQLIHQTIYGV